MIHSSLRFSKTLVASFLLAGAAPLLIAQSPQRAVVPIEVNGVSKGEILLLIGDDEFFVNPEDLGNVGIQGLVPETRRIADGMYVSLSSLAPAVTFNFDDSTYVLSLQVDASYLPHVTRSLATSRPAGIVSTRDTSAFLNYSVGSRRFEDLSIFGEGGLSVKGNLLYSSFSRSAEGGFARGLTNLTIDRPDRMRRLVLGDTFVVNDSLGGAALIGGMSVTRNFELDPYFVRYPSIDLVGAITSPSTVDIYVNGSLVRREQLPPGRFDLQDLPLTAGSGSTRLIIRDAFGQERTVDGSYYGSTALLSRGLSEYSYNLGFVRKDDSAANADYDETPVFSGFHRVGLSDSFTGGVRLEGGKDLASGGLSSGFLLPIGQMEFTAGASAADSTSGTAASLSYSYLSRKRFSLGGGVRVLSDHYANISLAPEEDRAKLNASMFSAATFGIATVGLQYASSANRDTPDVDRVGATVTFPVRRTNVFLSVARSDSDDSPPANEVFAGLSYYLGRSTTANFSASYSGEHARGSVDVQRSLPAGNGFGYRLSAPVGDSETISSALVQYQGPYGRYELSADPQDPSGEYSLRAAGGIVAIGGSVFLSRPFSQSFALMRVPDVSGVEVLSSNLKVGRTNRRGEFLIPNLLPYYGNRLGIEQQDIPFDYQIQQIEKVIAPPYRGGALVSFPLQKIQSVTGSIVILIDGVSSVPSYGTLLVSTNGKVHESPIGALGEFYLENAEAGTFPATVTHEGQVCRFKIAVPETGDAFVRLGTVRCSEIAR